MRSLFSIGLVMCLILALSVPAFSMFERFDRDVGIENAFNSNQSLSNVNAAITIESSQVFCQNEAASGVDQPLIVCHRPDPFVIEKPDKKSYWRTWAYKNEVSRIVYIPTCRHVLRE